MHILWWDIFFTNFHFSQDSKIEKNEKLLCITRINETIEDMQQ